jgi:hypothetical protein
MRGLASILLVLSLAGPAGGRESDAGGGAPEDSAAALKAAFVLNFARYTEWPAENFRGPDDPIEISVLGDARVAAALAKLAERAAPIAGRSVRVRALVAERLEAPQRLVADLSHVEVLFVGREAEPSEVSALLSGLAGAPLLTVGDGEEFAAAGGMLGLVPEEQRFVFDANPAAIASSRIEVSARVLKLARALAREERR